VSRGSWDGVSSPDPDRGNIDGSAEHVVTFVVTGGEGAVPLEFVDGAFDDVAQLVALGVELRCSPALVAPAEPVAALVGRFRDGCPDPASPQVRADGAAGVGLVAQHLGGSGPWPATTPAADPDPGHDRLEGQRIVAVTGGGDPADRAAAGVGGEVNLARQPTTRPAECFPAGLDSGFLVIRLGPPVSSAVVATTSAAISAGG